MKIILPTKSFHRNHPTETIPLKPFHRNHSKPFESIRNGLLFNIAQLSLFVVNNLANLWHSLPGRTDSPKDNPRDSRRDSRMWGWSNIKMAKCRESVKIFYQIPYQNRRDNRNDSSAMFRTKRNNLMISNCKHCPTLCRTVS